MKTPRPHLLCLFAAILFPAGCGPAFHVPWEGLRISLDVKETSLGRIDEDVPAFGACVDDNSWRFACSIQCGEKQRMPIDGVEGPLYDEVNFARFSKGGLHSYYMARRGEQWMAVVDGKEGPPFNGVTEWPWFSPDGRRVAYLAGRGTKGRVTISEEPSWESNSRVFTPWRCGYTGWGIGDLKLTLVVDGKEPQGNDENDKGVFSPDSRHFAYAAARGGKWRVVLDDAEGKPYDKIAGFPVFSPDSQHLAYAAKSGEKWAAVVDGREGRGYDNVEPPVFSPDSRRVAHIAGRDKKKVLVVDGLESRPYDDVGWPTFSPDSKRVACWVERDGRCLMLIDGEEGKPYDKPSEHFLEYTKYGPSIVFSPDSKRYAYTIRPDKDRQENEILVVDGAEVARHACITLPTFSPDSKRLAWILSNVGHVAGGIYGTAEENCRTTAVIDGKESVTWNIITRDPVFSPDSSQVVYWARSNRTPIFAINDNAYEGTLVVAPDWHTWAIAGGPPGRQQVEVTHVPGKVYDEVCGLVFSPDSRHAAWWAKRAKKWMLVVDGIEAPVADYDGQIREKCETYIRRATPIVFDGPDRLHTLAYRKPDVLRVEIGVLCRQP